MSASFEEKSVWIQLASTVAGLGAYFVIAWRMIDAGVRDLVPFAAVFLAAAGLLTAVMVAGHVVAAIASRPEGRDERDRLIEWRAESESSWLMAVGVFATLAAMVFSASPVWTANLLLATLFLTQVTSFVLRLVYYRRGVPGAGRA